MARRRPQTPQIPDAVREAVERTVQATVGGAKEAQENTNRRASGVRTRAASALDDIAKSAEAGAEVVQKRVREALEDARPATHDDVKAILKELRALNRRVAALEERLPAAAPAAAKKPAAKKPAAKRKPAPKKKA
jgi:hypothetical protein